MANTRNIPRMLANAARERADAIRNGVQGIRSGIQSSALNFLDRRYKRNLSNYKNFTPAFGSPAPWRELLKDPAVRKNMDMQKILPITGLEFDAAFNNLKQPNNPAMDASNRKINALQTTFQEQAKALLKPENIGTYQDTIQNKLQVLFQKTQEGLDEIHAVQTQVLAGNQAAIAPLDQAHQARTAQLAQLKADWSRRLHQDENAVKEEATLAYLRAYFLSEEEREILENQMRQARGNGEFEVGEADLDPVDPTLSDTLTYKGMKIVLAHDPQTNRVTSAGAEIDCSESPEAMMDKMGAFLDAAKATGATMVNMNFKNVQGYRPEELEFMQRTFYLEAYRRGFRDPNIVIRNGKSQFSAVGDAVIAKAKQAIDQRQAAQAQPQPANAANQAQVAEDNVRIQNEFRQAFERAQKLNLEAENRNALQMQQ
jgi:hypothetical protein